MERLFRVSAMLGSVLRSDDSGANERAKCRSHRSINGSGAGRTHFRACADVLISAPPAQRAICVSHGEIADRKVEQRQMSVATPDSAELQSEQGKMQLSTARLQPTI